MVSPEKIAVCLSCGNEWEVRKIDAKRRKCPICGKYRTKMKSEMTDEELQIAKGGKPEEKEPEKNENTGEKEENPPEKKENSPEENGGEKGDEKNGGGILLYAGILILALSAGWFLWRAVVARRAEREYYEDYGVNY